MSGTLYEIPLQKIDGTAATLAEHRGKVLLVVNVASKCGLTPQYAGLEQLHETYRDRGFSVVGFPANDFAGQEPGTDAEIREFCRATYGVQFPMYSKIRVTGANKHPLYRHLTAAQPKTGNRETMEQQLRGHGMKPTSAPEVLWNFEKFLVDRGGRVVGRFAPDTSPDAAPLVEAIESALAQH
jgi:glutathione peroxidase